MDTFNAGGREITEDPLIKVRREIDVIAQLTAVGI